MADDTFHKIHDTLEKQVHRPLVIIAGDERQQPPPYKPSMPVPSRPLRSWRTTVCMKSAKSSPCITSSGVLMRLTWTSCNTYDTANLNSTYSITSSTRCSRSISPIWRTTTYGKPLKNLDKSTGVVNGQLANIANNENNTLLLQFPNGKTTFTYPVTTTSEDGLSRVHYALNPAYSMTICKTQGANIKKLIVWFDCPTVPKGMGYVALSRVQKSENIKILSPMVTDQLTPALGWTLLTTGNLSSWKHTAYSSQDPSRCYKTLSQTRSARLHNLPYSSNMTKHFTPLACLLLARTRCQIAAEQRYTYPLKQHSSPPNAQSHQQSFVCSYVTTNAKPMDPWE